MEILISILIIILCAKWLAVIMMFPWICFWFQYTRHKGLLRKVLAAPGVLLEKVTNEGASRFVIINIGNIPSIGIRLLLYRMLGVRAGKKVVVHYKTEIRAPFNLQLGEGTIIGDNALLDARNKLLVGNNVNFSSNVSVYTEQHDHRDRLFRCIGGDNGMVTIGDRAWIGSNVIILPGVKIGEGAVCCAGCVVTKDVAPFDVVAGIPAKKVNTRPKDLAYEFDGKTCWFY